MKGASGKVTGQRSKPQASITPTAIGRRLRGKVTPCGLRKDGVFKAEKIKEITNKI